MTSQAERDYDAAASQLIAAQKRFFEVDPTHHPMFGLGKSATQILAAAMKIYSAALHPHYRTDSSIRPAPPGYYDVVISNLEPGDDPADIVELREQDRLTILRMRAAWR